ncbi:MAG: hypothetical protein NZO58_01350 [Gemmataceae bacterium]|nr:hypothetical protein [Gemmataceae bacterium]
MNLAEPLAAGHGGGDAPSSAAKKTDLPGPRPWRLKLCLALLMILPSWYFIWRHFQRPSISFEFKANRPMLDRLPGDYKADDVGLRFTPPPKWSMQLTSNEDPEHPLKERIVVKFKRIVAKAPAAWLRVTIVTTDNADEPIAETVKNRSPGKGWKSVGPPENLTISGLPAAKMTYHGDYSGARSIRELIGVRRGNRVFYFMITYQVADRAAQEEARQALQTVLIEPR